MCGRYTLTANMDELQARFGFESHVEDYRPSYNVAPSQQVLTVVNDGQRRAGLMRWGLIPSWATADARGGGWVSEADTRANYPKIGYRMINAVGETAATKPAFRAAFRRRRCLVLADGFFEWRKEEKARHLRGIQRIPTYFHLKSGQPFAFAGLWETWKSPEGDTVRSCSIVTTQANDLIAPVHHRMPVILSPETEPLWLDPLTEEAETLEPLLAPAPSEEIACYIVSGAVNSVKNSGPECIEPAPAPETTLRLL